MSLRLKALRGSLLLMLGEGVVLGASFLRNMILARMLSKADFGIAATFSLIITLLEFSAKMGVARFVVRDKEGNDPEFIATAHLVQFVATALSAIAIAASAVPLSILFDLREQQWAIFVLALAPLLRSLEHLDVRRFERDLRFAPSLAVEAIPQVVATIAAWPLAAWLRDYRAVLVLLLAKTLASSLASHLLSEQPYRWRCHRDYIVRMLRFGWPLLINGFLMFAVHQGDQFLVATFYTMADLGVFAAAAALTVAPTLFFGRVFNSVALPILAQAQDDPAVFAQRYRQVLAGAGLFAVACGLGMILAGEALMTSVYGAKYAGGGILLAWLSAANAFRILRVAPALAALAKGDSQNQMMSNAWRMVAIAPAAFFAVTRQPLWLIACTGVLGEALGCWASFVRLRRRDGVPLSTSLVPAGWTLLAVVSAGMLASLGLYGFPPLVGLTVGTLGTILGALAMLAVLPELRHESLELCSRWRQRGWRGCLEDLRGATSRTVASTP